MLKFFALLLFPCIIACPSSFLSLLYSTSSSCSFDPHHPTSYNGTPRDTVNIICIARDCGGKGISLLKDGQHYNGGCESANETYAKINCTFDLSQLDEMTTFQCQGRGDNSHIYSVLATVQVQRYIGAVTNIDVSLINDSHIEIRWVPPPVLYGIDLSYIIHMIYVDNNSTLFNKTLLNNSHIVNISSFDVCKDINMTIISVAGNTLYNSSYWTGPIHLPSDWQLNNVSINNISSTNDGNVSLIIEHQDNTNCYALRTGSINISIAYNHHQQQGMDNYIIIDGTTDGNTTSFELSLPGNDTVNLSISSINTIGSIFQLTLPSISTYDIQNFTISFNGSVTCYQCDILTNSYFTSCSVNISSTINNVSVSFDIPKDQVQCGSDGHDISTGVYNVCVYIQPSHCDIITTSVHIIEINATTTISPTTTTITSTTSSTKTTTTHITSSTSTIPSPTTLPIPAIVGISVTGGAVIICFVIVILTGIYICFCCYCRRPIKSKAETTHHGTLQSSGSDLVVTSRNNNIPSDVFNEQTSNTTTYSESADLLHHQHDNNTNTSLKIPGAAPPIEITAQEIKPLHSSNDNERPNNDTNTPVKKPPAVVAGVIYEAVQVTNKGECPIAPPSAVDPVIIYSDIDHMRQAPPHPHANRPMSTVTVLPPGVSDTPPVIPAKRRQDKPSSSDDTPLLPGQVNNNNTTTTTTDDNTTSGPTLATYL